MRHFKLALKVFCFLPCFALLLAGNVHAYPDPSVMTYTIQVVAGVVVAVGAVTGVYWRKAKKKVKDKMGIDENARKEVEEDVVEIKDINDQDRA